MEGRDKEEGIWFHPDHSRGVLHQGSSASSQLQCKQLWGCRSKAEVGGTLKCDFGGVTIPLGALAHPAMLLRAITCAQVRGREVEKILGRPSLRIILKSEHPCNNLIEPEGKWNLKIINLKIQKQQETPSWCAFWCCCKAQTGWVFCPRMQSGGQCALPPRPGQGCQHSPRIRNGTLPGGEAVRVG